MRLDQMHEVEVALLGTDYLESRRIARRPVGRVRLTARPGGSGPEHADLFLVTHTAGAALWEAWMTVADQPLDAARFAAWIRSDVVGSPAAVLRERVTAPARQLSPLAVVEDAFPFTILRRPGDGPPIEALLAEQGSDLVRLLYLDRSRLAFKRALVEAELARDFCLHEGGVSLLSPRSALDLRTGEGPAADPVGSVALAPRSALPLLISIELLLIERAVLRLFHERLAETGALTSLSHLAQIKAEVLDGLEEYRGTVAESNRFSGEVTAYGERLLGLDVLFRTLNERLEHLTFEITTRYQQTTTVLQFSLTVVLGALQAASVGAFVAAVHYTHDPLAVLAWAAGAGLAAASAITLLLRRRLH